MLYLYHGTTSVCSIKVRLTLEEKALAWQGEILHLQRGDQFRPEYLKLNPNAVVPTLVHDGRVIIESTVIMEYLEEVFPDIPLLPETPYQRSQARQWLRRVDDLHGACAILTTAIAFRRYFMSQQPDGRAAYVGRVTNPARREKLRLLMEDGLATPEATIAAHQYDKFVQEMNDALEGSAFLAGSSFSLADAAAIPYIVRAETLGLEGLWLEQRPRVSGWLERVRRRETFDRAVASYWDDDARQRFNVSREDVWREARRILHGA
jgi:glutathione S-transferase